MPAADNDDEKVTPPRKNPDLVGHGAAEQTLLHAYNSGRLPHAWLFSGPKGIGKATLAYRFARFLFASGNAEQGLFAAEAPTSLYVEPDDPSFHQIAAEAHPNLRVIERSIDPKTKRMRSGIAVEQIRELGGFFAMTSADGGWRVAIIDGADEMNRNSANAILKILEEPPAKSVLILVNHGRGRMLATIRSRCRSLPMRPLSDEDAASVVAKTLDDEDPRDTAALARLAEGSPGRALELAEADGLKIYRQLIELAEKLPAVSYQNVHALGDRLNRKDGEVAYRAWTGLLDLWLSRSIRIAGGGSDPGEAVSGEWALARRIAASGRLDRWVELWEKVRHLAERAESLNLERKQVVLNTFAALEMAARENLAGDQA